MKALIRVSFFFAILILFSSCATRIPLAESRAQNNSTYDVAYLFEHDGCKVYRFFDRGNYIYFTSCNGELTNLISDSTRIQTINLNALNIDE